MQKELTSVNTYPDTVERWLTLLTQSGYRRTSTRRTVVEVILESHSPLTIEEVVSVAHERNPNMGRATVYRTMEKLEELGLIQRVHHIDSCRKFMTVDPDKPCQLVCQSCKEMRTVDVSQFDAIWEQLALQSGYHLNAHWLQLVGICEKCREQISMA